MTARRAVHAAFALVLVTTSFVCAQKRNGERAGATRPNILWITSEDNASHWLGCYGNTQAKTPRLDALAKEGNRFRAAFSNAPVCAVARSTILTGVYAVAQGTQHMRSRHAIPARFRPYPKYLRDAGYYCANRSKTDFNIRGDDKAVWDACGRRAHYRDRPDGAPFFQIFNLTLSHESSLFPQKVAAMRRRGVIPKKTRLDVDEVYVPPYLPDLPEVRRDFAIYHDTMTALDHRVGEILDELERGGLADDTIVFYYADHGGPTPRGKRYLEDTGVRVPWIVHVPEKWRALSPFAPGAVVDEPVAFVDLAPTLLSLTGIEVPLHMQGRAFLGAQRVEPESDAHVFLFADRFDELYGMRRGLTDGRWKHQRRFTPQLPAAPYSYYQFSMPSWTAMQNAWKSGQLSGYHRALWEGDQDVECLFDTKSDPWELTNLAGDAEHAARLRAMRARLRATMARVGDSGVIPEPMFEKLARTHGTIHAYVQSDACDLERVLDLAFVASERNADRVEALLAALREDDPVLRYHALQGLLILGRRKSPSRDSVLPLLDDPQPVNRITAAELLFVWGGRARATKALIAELDKTTNNEALQLLVNVLTRSGLDREVPVAWIEAIRKNPRAGQYLKRFAERLARTRR